MADRAGRRHPCRARPGRDLPIGCGHALRARAARAVGWPRHRRDRSRASAPPGAELPAGGDAGRTRAGRDRASASGSTTRRGRCGSTRAPPVVPALEAAGFAPDEHRCRGLEPPPFRPRRGPAADGRLARLPASHRRRPEGGVGGRAGRQPARRGLVRPAGAAARPRLGLRRLGRGRTRAPARRHASCRRAATPRVTRP